MVLHSFPFSLSFEGQMKWWRVWLVNLKNHTSICSIWHLFSSALCFIDSSIYSYFSDILQKFSILIKNSARPRTLQLPEGREGSPDWGPLVMADCWVVVVAAFCRAIVSTALPCSAFLGGCPWSSFVPSLIGRHCFFISNSCCFCSEGAFFLIWPSLMHWQPSWFYHHFSILTWILSVFRKVFSNFYYF